MASFLLAPDETLPDGLRRIVLEQLDEAAVALRGEPEDFDTALHEARKSFKRVRAILQLIRDDIGRLAFKEENRCFRDAGRALAPARDRFVLRLTLESLAESAPDGSTAEYLRELAHRTAIGPEAASLWRDGQVRELLSTLARAGARAADWALDDEHFSLVRPGLERTHRRGAARMRKALERDTAATYHAWRRRVKELWYQLQILSSAAPALLEPRVADLDALGETLGTEHDFALARMEIVADGAAGREAHDALHLLDETVSELRNRAGALGVTVYLEPSEELVNGIEAGWGVWRSRAGRPNTRAGPHEGGAITMEATRGD